MKRTLVEQAGGKCANPGCPNRLIEIHHIKEWAVYHTHDAEHMIAICPTCHDQVTRGTLRITDDELYRWKGIDRSKAAFVGSIFVEPGPAPSLSLATCTFMGADGITIFDFESQKLSFAVRDGELVVLNLKLTDSTGRLLVDVVDNYVRQRSPEVSIESRTGRWLVRGELTSDFLPEWASTCLGKVPSYNASDVALLDIEVMAPGQVRVAGVWVDDQHGIVVDERNDRILLLSRRKNIALGFVTPGSTIGFFGDFNQSVFGSILPEDF